MRRTFLTLFLVLSIAPSLGAQRAHALSLQGFRATLHAPTLSTDRGRPSPIPANMLPKALDHRWEGIIVGSALLAAGGAIFANGMCHYQSSNGNCIAQTLGGLAIGGIFGAGVGGLVGGLIPKSLPASP